MGQLAQKVRAKYPGEYDDLSDADLESKVLAKYPEYADLASSAPAEAAPEEEPKVGKHPLAAYGEGAMKGVGEGLLAMVNPMTYVRTAGAAVDLASNPTKVPGAVVAAAKGVGQFAKNAFGLEGPEKMGEAHGSLVPSAIPVGGLLKKVAEFGKNTRAANVIKAVGATTNADKARIESLVNQGRLELPVSATRGSLAAKIDEQLAAAGPELESAKAGLKNLPAAPVGPVIKGIKAERPVVTAGTAKKPVEASANRPLVNAIDNQVDELVKAAGPGRSLKPDVIQALKEQAQDAAAKAYKAAREAGQDVAPGAEASELVARALRETLENNPGIPADVRGALTAANRRIEPLMAIKTPMEARRLENLGKPFWSRSIEGLAGRAAVPLALGGSGAYVAGPAGAVAGLGAGAFLQSALWNTLSAAGKAKVGPILESQGVQAAVQAAFAAHIAENAARNTQE